MQIHGPILTNCTSLDRVQTSIRAGGFTALKVVTGWGSPTGWNPTTMARVAGMVPHLVVRTVAGDPSYNGGSQPLPTPDRVLKEIAPWYAVRKDIMIEIGNEPNRAGWPEQFAWVYRYYLALSIPELRRAFPAATLIAPALLVQPDTNAQRWLEIDASNGSPMSRCDYIGIHAYEHDAFVATQQRHGTTGQFAAVRDLYARFFPGKPLILSEYGINDPATTGAAKGARYAALVKRNAVTPPLSPSVVGALYYHICDDGVIDPQYHIGPTGDSAYGLEMRR